MWAARAAAIAHSYKWQWRDVDTRDISRGGDGSNAEKGRVAEVFRASNFNGDPRDEKYPRKRARHLSW